MAPLALVTRISNVKRRLSLLILASCLTLGFTSTSAQIAGDDAARSAGASDYALLCAGCHEGALLEAPQRSALALFSPARIV